MSLKSFFTDYKKIGKLYSLFFLIEIVLTVVLLLVLNIISSIVLLPFIFLLAFIVVQFYMYYEFQRRLIKNVYNPEFNKNKNIIIMMAISTVIIILLLLYFVGAIINIINNPIFIFKFIKSLDTIKFFSYLMSILLIGLYAYLLFDIKKVKKIIFISLSFFSIEMIINLVLKNILTSMLYLIGYSLSFFDWIGIILFLLISLIFVIVIVTFYKTLFIQLVKYFKEENIIETKLNQLFGKIKELLKIK